MNFDIKLGFSISHERDYKSLYNLNDLLQRCGEAADLRKYLQISCLE